MEISKKELIKIYKKNKQEYSKYLPEYNSSMLEQFVYWAISFKSSPIFTPMPPDIIVSDRMTDLYYIKELIKHYHPINSYMHDNYDTFKMELLCAFLDRGVSYFIGTLDPEIQWELVRLFFRRKEKQIIEDAKGDETCIFVKIARLISSINKYYYNCSELWKTIDAGIDTIRQKISANNDQNYYYNLYVNSPVPELVDLFDYDIIRRFSARDYNKYLFSKYLSMITDDNYEENRMFIIAIVEALGNGIINTIDNITEFVDARLI
jgi:hypothetical protein